MPAPDPQPENPPQSLFVDETFGMTHVRKQDICYFLPESEEILTAVQDYLRFEKWAGLTPEERLRVVDLFESELARKVKNG